MIFFKRICVGMVLVLTDPPFAVSPLTYWECDSGGRHSWKWLTADTTKAGHRPQIGSTSMRPVKCVNGRALGSHKIGLDERRSRSSGFCGYVGGSAEPSTYPQHVLPSSPPPGKRAAQSSPSLSVWPMTPHSGTCGSPSTHRSARKGWRRPVATPPWRLGRFRPRRSVA
jgi:hypothetical protein